MSETAPQTDDLSGFELEDTCIQTFQNAAGTGDLMHKGKPVQIELYGPGSDVVRKLELQEARATAKRMKAVLQGKTDPEEDEKANVARLVRRTVRLINFPATPEQMFGNRKLVYMHRQVERWLNDEANFSKASTTT
jgi:hypothetical protein